MLYVPADFGTQSLRSPTVPTIFLVRHAEPDYGWSGDDSTRPLSERGRRQAHATARLLSGHVVTELRSAPHRRCMETAAIIGAELGLEPAPEQALHIARAFDLPKVHGVMVWVAHSNNIPGALFGAGVQATRCGMASAWQVETDEAGNVLSATYHEPDSA
jgi:hypothetical protein